MRYETIEMKIQNFIRLFSNGRANLPVCLARGTALRPFVYARRGSARPTAALALLVMLFAFSSTAQDSKTSSASGKILYENNFEKADLDGVPDEFLVLDGGFSVKQEATNKFLELPGAPLETFGLLFGPTLESGVATSARMRGDAKGRRYPTFALGLNGVSGYRLQVSPAKDALELYKGDDVVATSPFEEKMGSWLKLRLQVLKTGEAEWKVEGKVWLESAAEPEKAQITFEEKSKPIAGRATIWGCPYAGKPIQFDDLAVTELTVK